MTNDELNVIVSELMAIAPSDWTSMRVIYRFDESMQMGVTEPYAQRSPSGDEWVPVGCDRFEMMDMFDAARERSVPGPLGRWTKATVTISRGQSEPRVDLDHGDPRLFPESSRSSDGEVSTSDSASASLDYPQPSSGDSTYSAEELMQCIFDCATESLPEGWYSASLYAALSSGSVYGTFRFTRSEAADPVEFTPPNSIAALNAVIELQRLAVHEGRAWNSILVAMSPNGEMRVASE